jgi:hypothetical protein
MQLRLCQVSESEWEPVTDFFSLLQMLVINGWLWALGKVCMVCNRSSVQDLQCFATGFRTLMAEHSSSVLLTPQVVCVIQ